MARGHCVLVIDDDDTTLGGVALRMIRLGIDVFYVKDPNEALLLAQQESERVRVLAFPPSVRLSDVTGIRDRLEAGGSAGPPTLLVIGERPDDRVHARLRRGGVSLALWDTEDDSALRQIVVTAMASCEGHAERREPRTPTTLLGRVFVGIHRKDVIVSTLSEGGAFLETPTPFEPGTRVTLELELDGGAFIGKAEVVYSRDSEGPRQPEQPCGMGVTFMALGPAAEKRLKEFLAKNEGRFSV